MPNLVQIKTFLYSRYPGKQWRKKIEEMPEDQLVAVYYSIKSREEKKGIPEPKKDEMVQLSLFRQ